MQRLAIPGNHISTKMTVFLNPRKLIPTKINESTVSNIFFSNTKYCVHRTQCCAHTIKFPFLVNHKIWVKTTGHDLKEFQILNEHMI